MSGYQRDRVWWSPSASIAANSTPAKPNQLINAWATVDLPIRPLDCNEQMILLGPGLPSSSGSSPSISFPVKRAVIEFWSVLFSSDDSWNALVYVNFRFLS
jgi:hypothetical protein